MGDMGTLLSAVDADPGRLVELAIERLVPIEGKPTTFGPRNVRFRPHKSLWINRQTGDWRDWIRGVGGGSWLLATELANISVAEIRELYGLSTRRVFTRSRRRALRAAVAEQSQRLAAEELAHRMERREQAQQLYGEAQPSTETLSLIHI